MYKNRYEINHNQIKEELKQLLSVFQEFLKQNELKYTVMSGTLLGCIRHGGFIPWDDDIDVGMLREDYNKLLKILKKNGNVINYNTTAIAFELGNSDWPFLKIINKSVLVKESNANIEENLWIDVFPFDNICKEHINRINKIDKTSKRLIIKKINRRLGIHDKKRKNTFNQIYDKLCDFFSYFISTNQLLQYHLRLCEADNKYITDLVCDIVWGKKCIPSSLFDELTDYQFEDIVVKGFKDYDTYLKYIYGDYMKLPPKEQRVNHGVQAWRIKNNEE